MKHFLRFEVEQRCRNREKIAELCYWLLCLIVVASAGVWAYVNQTSEVVEHVLYVPSKYELVTEAAPGVKIKQLDLLGPDITRLPQEQFKKKAVGKHVNVVVTELSSYNTIAYYTISEGGNVLVTSHSVSTAGASDWLKAHLKTGEPGTYQELVVNKFAWIGWVVVTLLIFVVIYVFLAVNDVIWHWAQIPLRRFDKAKAKKARAR